MKHDDRVEWLQHLESEPDALAHLCSESGSLARAAWRVATARCGVVSTETLHSVASELVARVGYFDVVPPAAVLHAECARSGLSLR